QASLGGFVPANRLLPPVPRLTCPAVFADGVRLNKPAAAHPTRWVRSADSCRIGQNRTPLDTLGHFRTRLGGFTSPPARWVRSARNAYAETAEIAKIAK